MGQTLSRKPINKSRSFASPFAASNGRIHRIAIGLADLLDANAPEIDKQVFIAQAREVLLGEGRDILAQAEGVESETIKALSAADYLINMPMDVAINNEAHIRSQLGGIIENLEAIKRYISNIKQL